MEAQTINLHFFTAQYTKNANFLAKPTGFPQSPNWVSLKSPNLSFFGSFLKKSLSLTSSCVVKAKMGIDDELRQEIGRKKLAVFVSGGGSNFRAIYEAILDGRINGDIVVLVASKTDCGGASYARDKGIPVIVFPEKKDGSEGLSPHNLVIALRKYEVDYILLAGYLKLIPAELIRAYPRSILNIHPSLLPAFGGKGYYGMKVHRAVITSGARYSGPTIHFVDEHYDTGRILAQRVVPVLPTDTADELAAKVLQEEHHVYVEVAAVLCEERIIWREDGVPLIRSKENPDNYS
ncbi:phosphoribosylglycinamide formyltransferase, chloroplastic [Apium graveolens]|uniref:phosphoribosylglycinamide formyltransferase, chloroplastic n=1 Tax=Apium graveolens TaxID=4045 RepID=UPI003D7BA7A3